MTVVNYKYNGVVRRLGCLAVGENTAGNPLFRLIWRHSTIIANGSISPPPGSSSIIPPSLAGLHLEHVTVELYQDPTLLTRTHGTAVPGDSSAPHDALLISPSPIQTVQQDFPFLCLAFPLHLLNSEPLDLPVLLYQSLAVNAKEKRRHANLKARINSHVVLSHITECLLDIDQAMLAHPPCPLGGHETGMAFQLGFQATHAPLKPDERYGALPGGIKEDSTFIWTLTGPSFGKYKANFSIQYCNIPLNSKEALKINMGHIDWKT